MAALGVGRRYLQVVQRSDELLRDVRQSAAAARQLASGALEQHRGQLESLARLLWQRCRQLHTALAVLRAEAVSTKLSALVCTRTRSAIALARSTLLEYVRA